MNEDEQRVAIATSRGWRKLASGGWQKPNGEIENQYYGEVWRLPDYLRDLNAIHEAWRSLVTIAELDQFNRHLRFIVQRDAYATASVALLECVVLGATADQRAEAYLRTMNLWVDQEN